MPWLSETFPSTLVAMTTNTRVRVFRTPLRLSEFVPAVVITEGVVIRGAETQKLRVAVRLLRLANWRAQPKLRSWSGPKSGSDLRCNRLTWGTRLQENPGLQPIFSVRRNLHQIPEATFCSTSARYIELPAGSRSNLS